MGKELYSPSRTGYLTTFSNTLDKVQVLEIGLYKLEILERSDEWTTHPNTLKTWETWVIELKNWLDKFLFRVQRTFELETIQIENQHIFAW